MSGLRLDGRVAVVTGAGRGLGQAYASYLATLGAKVVVNDLGASTTGTGGDKRPADDVVAQIQAAGGTATANYSDISVPEGGKSVVDTAIEAFGGLDIVVNNAGNMVWGALPEAGPDVVEAHWAVHVRGTYNVTYAAWPHFLARNYGRVVLTTSIGMFGLPENIGYAIAKASMIGMAKSMTVGRGDADINVNCLAPNGLTRIAGRTEEEGEAMVAMSARLDPALVAPMVGYLAHESCTDSGEVYVAGGNRFGRLFVAMTEGYLYSGSGTPTIDDVAANLTQIRDEAGYYQPISTDDAGARFLGHLRLGR